MKIGLLDIDGHHFPNLALMKLSAWHKQQRDHVEFATMFESYDIIYKSKIFTFSTDDKFIYDTQCIIQGGTGYKKYETTLKPEIEKICPDYELYRYPHAMGFLTRGCPNRCFFCIVPQKEGQIRQHQDIEDFLAGRKSAVLLDNNVLAHEWGLSQLEKIIRLKVKVDFNQGLDARIIAKSDEIVKLLAKILWLMPLRMACDTDQQLENVIKATEKMQQAGVTPRRYFVYLLVTKDIESALYRARKIKELGLDAFAQPFVIYEDNVVITREQKEFCRWVNKKQLFKSVDFTEYKQRVRKY